MIKPKDISFVDGKLKIVRDGKTIFYDPVYINHLDIQLKNDGRDRVNIIFIKSVGGPMKKFADRVKDREINGP